MKWSWQPAGKSSQLLELLNKDGEIKAVYIKSGEEGVAVGKFLRNVHFEEKNGTYGPYNLMTRYDMAA